MDDFLFVAMMTPMFLKDYTQYMKLLSDKSSITFVILSAVVEAICSCTATHIEQAVCARKRQQHYDVSHRQPGLHVTLQPHSSSVVVYFVHMC